ncbi:MAG: metallophosphoesterase family protein [Symbiobacteriia bacterium]
MLIAVISDLHANLEATESVLRDIEQHGVQQVFCLGDLVNYGPSPTAVIDLVRARAIPTVMGNHDWNLGNAVGPDNLRVAPGRDLIAERAAYAWTQARLPPEDRLFLHELAQVRREPFGPTTAVFAHGTPASFTQYLRLTSPESEWDSLVRDAAASVVFLGHTHVPYVKRHRDALVCNVGSVGRPKDGNPAACYAIARLGDPVRIELVRVGYDIEATAEKIRRSGLPPGLARSLLAARGL